MTPLDISTAPKDGTRILLQYHTRHFQSYGQPHQVTGTKWEECRFFDDKAITTMDSLIISFLLGVLFAACFFAWLLKGYTIIQDVKLRQLKQQAWDAGYKARFQTSK